MVNWNHSSLPVNAMPPLIQILIVEDDEIISNLISVIVEKKGYAVAGKVATGEGAVMKAAECMPDLVLMDINLAGTFDGISAARYIYSIFRIPVIFLTGQYDDSILARAKVAEPYGFILKPFTSNDIVSNIELALYNHSIRKRYFDKAALWDMKKIMAALESVIITDTRGRIIFLNPYSCRLLDVLEKDALTQPLKQILILVNKQTGERINDPALDVIRDKIVVSYEQNTVLVTLKNKKRRVSLTARPVKDDRNEMIGVSVHIREKTLTEIKMAEKN
jgi:DNA-binding NarL/FixJ family response regulator